MIPSRQTPVKHDQSLPANVLILIIIHCILPRVEGTSWISLSRRLLWQTSLSLYCMAGDDGDAANVVLGIVVIILEEVSITVLLPFWCCYCVPLPMPSWAYLKKKKKLSRKHPCIYWTSLYLLEDCVHWLRTLCSLFLNTYSLASNSSFYSAKAMVEVTPFAALFNGDVLWSSLAVIGFWGGSLLALAHVILGIVLIFVPKLWWRTFCCCHCFWRFLSSVA